MSLIKRPTTARKPPIPEGETEEHPGDIYEAVRDTLVESEDVSVSGVRIFGLANTILRDIPSNWAKVDGAWHHIPDEHFITVEAAYKKSDTGYRMEPTVDWTIEHSLPCRIRGMADCELQALWVEHLEQDGWWPNDGRYRLVMKGENTPRDDVFEDTRTIEFEEVVE